MVITQYDSLLLSGDTYKNYLSQSKESAIMDIRENQPLEIALPFISHKPMMRLFNTSAAAISDTTSFQDIVDMGTLVLKSINNFKCINPDGDNIRYYVYAWMDNIELGAPTGTHLQIRTESGVSNEKSIQNKKKKKGKKDERVTGPVQNFASSAKEISSALSSVPMIAPLAMASTIGFGALEQVASIFGWARPIVEVIPGFVKNLGYQNGAQTIGPDTSFKVSLDPKQELTIDGFPTQDEEDQLAISYLASRTTFLTTFEWRAIDVPNVPIWSTAVTPYLNSVELTGPLVDQPFIQPTAMSYVTRPFAYWRGDVEFTFEFVCSQYHRGKMLVMFDPNMNHFSLISGSVDLNKQYVKVIDLQETQTVTFCVKWAHDRSWASAARLTNYEPYSNSSVYNLSAADAPSFNGMVYLAPFNQLTSPDASDIAINVYVKCPNLMVNRYIATHMGQKRIVTESEVDELAISSQSVGCFPLNESNATTDSICIEHFGERPVSLRSLMKRFTLCDTTVPLTVPVGTAFTRLFISGAIMPKVTPYQDPVRSRGIFDYLRPAYVGVRGSVRKRIQILSPLRSLVNGPLQVGLDSLDVTATALAFQENPLALLESYLPSEDGYVSFIPDSNGGIEVDFPFYSPNLFEFSFAPNGVGTNPGGSQNMDDRWTKNFKASSFVEVALTQQFLNLAVLTASGEDFTFLRFQGAPPYLN